MLVEPFDAVGCPQKPAEAETSELNPAGNGAGAPGFVPDLLEWMGRGFGSAVQRAKYPLEGLLQALPAAIYATDTAGRITFYNEAAAKLWGCRPEIGKTEFCGSWKLYWPDGSGMAHDQCPMALALKERREIRGVEAIAERPDGTRVHFVPYPTLLYDAEGTLVGAVNMLVDISDRKRADITAQRLASIIESSDDAIISKDLNGLITSWNRGAEELFGYTEQEVIGKPVTILIPSERIDEEPDILGRIRRGERITHYDTIRRRKDGRLIEISLSVSPIRDADGRIVGASKIARDVTDRNRAQERQKLVVSEMKHRIKNSLATIQAIANQTLKHNAEERDAFIGRLHALDRAHDVLTSESWERTSLGAIVNRALEPFQQQHGDRIRVDGSGYLWLDSSKGVMIAMVVHELATNAVKHGALSNGTGQINISWDRTAQPDLVKLVWRESGGPKVASPKQRGFGSHLIERAFGGQLGAAQLVFDPSGLTCTLEIAV